jgi:hypothetical protein
MHVCRDFGAILAWADEDGRRLFEAGEDTVFL